jgi:hypothetical protein
VHRALSAEAAAAAAIGTNVVPTLDSVLDRVARSPVATERQTAQAHCRRESCEAPRVMNDAGVAMHMKNPWLDIAEGDYVGHMSSPAVNQRPVLNRLLRDALARIQPRPPLGSVVRRAMGSSMSIRQ